MQPPTSGLPPTGGYPPAGTMPPTGGYPAGAVPPSSGYPPAGAVPPSGGYPPAGTVPPSGGYPPAGTVPPSGGYPPAGAVPPSGGYPQAGAVPPGGANSPAGAVPPGADVMPSAPPMEKMDAIEGYENSFFSGGDIPPPSYDESVRGAGPPDRTLDSNIPSLTEDLAREALYEFLSHHCCYGKKPAQEMQMQGLETSMAFHYTLDTFTEARSTEWAMEPFVGQPIDGPYNGPAPGPWDMAIVPSKKFADSKATAEVPHTASVKPCHKCVGIGRVRCNSCMGKGRNTCTMCNGSGRKTVYSEGTQSQVTCDFCEGLGRRVCMMCNGHGQRKCLTCDGKGQLKCYIKLTVKWKNHDDQFILERTALPDHLIAKATGQIAFDEEQPMVWPINHFPVPDVNQASRQLVDTHRTKWPRERILLQRHRVRVVPVTEVSYRWKDKQGKFFVYGNEHLVHAPDYPQKCCCGCVIL